MSSDEEKATFYKLLAKLIAKEMKRSSKKSSLSTDDQLLKALFSQRQLPGARLERKARPLTDFLKKIKKQQRKAIKGALIKYRKSVKSQQKALVVQNRKQNKKAYKKK